MPVCVSLGNVSVKKLKANSDCFKPLFHNKVMKPVLQSFFCLVKMLFSIPINIKTHFPKKGFSLAGLILNVIIPVVTLQNSLFV